MEEDNALEPWEVNLKVGLINKGLEPNDVAHINRPVDGNCSLGNEAKLMINASVLINTGKVDKTLDYIIPNRTLKTTWRDWER